MKILTELKKIFNAKIQNTDNDSVRTIVVKKNILLSLISKGLTVVISFAILPLAIEYLNKYQFGIYATINSVVLWIDLFDFGLGQGLRNNLTNAIVHNNKKLAKEYISTTYAIVILISVVLGLVFFVLNYFINWNSVLNVKNFDTNLLRKTVFVVFFFFFLRFISNLITKVLFAMQYSAWVAIIQMLQKLLLLIALLILLHFTESSIFYYASAQSFILFITPLLIGIYFYNTKFIDIAPKPKYVNKVHTKKLMGLGVKFFIIQIASLIMFSSNNLMIAYFTDPEYVTTYQVAYNLFNSLTILFMLVITPLWSAYTEAWKLKRYAWIKNTIKKIIFIYLVITLIAIMILFLSPFIYQHWIGNEVKVSIITSLLVCLLILINLWTRIFDFFLNGASKIHLQMVLLIIAAIINVPVSYFFAVIIKMGLNGVILGSIISFSFTALSSPLQTYLILSKKAKGIWLK